MYAWFDDFVQMMDKVNDCNSNITFLEDLNMDPLKSQHVWESTTSLFDLPQRIICATRVRPTTTTLLHHIYRKNEQMV